MTDEFLCRLPKVIKLENAGGTMLRRKSKVVLRYHRPNKKCILKNALIIFCCCIIHLGMRNS